jgi:hypothetical protein
MSQNQDARSQYVHPKNVQIWFRTFGVLDVRVSDILASHILVWDVILVYGHFASAPNYLHILFCSYTLTKRIGNPGM